MIRREAPDGVAAEPPRPVEGQAQVVPPWTPTVRQVQTLRRGSTETMLILPEGQGSATMAPGALAVVSTGSSKQSLDREPCKGEEPVTEGGGISTRDVLCRALRVFRRCAPANLLAVLILEAIPVCWGSAVARDPLAAWGAWGLLLLLAELVASLASIAAGTLAALQLAGGEQVRTLRLLAGGLRHAWLTFRVLFLSTWWVMLTALAAAFLARPAAFRFHPERMDPSAPHVRYWLVAVATSLAYAVAMARCFPALPIALSTPRRGARDAVRRAREMTRGFRPRLLQVAVVAGCLSLPATLLYDRASGLAHGDARAVLLFLHGLLWAALTSFTGVLPPVIHLRLSRELGGFLDLARVFE